MHKNDKTTASSPRKFLFQRKNYLFLFAGIFCIALGFILMSGGGSDDVNVFNHEIYSFRRIRLAPMLVLAGLSLQVYAILVHSDKNKK